MDETLAVNSFLGRILSEAVPRHFLDISSDNTKENANNFQLQNSTLKNDGPHNGPEINDFTKFKGSSLDQLDDLINNCLDSVAFGVNSSISPNILSQCLQMGRGYRDQAYLKRNMLFPTGDVPFMCSICGLEFENKIQITDHIKIHTADNIDYLTAYTAFNKLDKTQIGKLPTIDIIPLVSQEKSPVMDKQIVMDKQTVIDKPTVDNKQNAANTEDLILNDFQCSECGKIFSNPYSLKRHKLLHAPVKPFTCKVCGKGFTERSKLKRHLFIHAGIRPFECKICGHAFIEKNRLNLHMNTHSDQKDHKCSECGKVFRTEYNLKRHTLVHSDIKKGYSGLLNDISIPQQMATLSEEQMATLSEEQMATLSEQKDHKCSECGKAFRTEYNLKRHTLTHAEAKKVLIEID